MAKEKTAAPVSDDDCFGKFYDPKDGDCKSCNENKKCAAMMAKGKSAAAETDDEDDEEDAPPAKKGKEKPAAKGKEKPAKAVEPDDDDEEEEEAPTTKKKQAPPTKTKSKSAPEPDEDDDDEEEAPPVKKGKEKPAAKPAPADDDDEEEPDDEELEALTNTIKKKARLVAKAVLAGKSLVTYSDGKLEIKAFDAKKVVKQSKKKQVTPEQKEFRDYCRTTLKDDEKMIALCHKLKLKWQEHDTPMVNRMRATMALKDYYFKNELSLDDLTKALKGKK